MQAELAADMKEPAPFVFLCYAVSTVVRFGQATQ